MTIDFILLFNFLTHWCKRAITKSTLRVVKKLKLHFTCNYRGAIPELGQECNSQQNMQFESHQCWMGKQNQLDIQCNFVVLLYWMCQQSISPSDQMLCWGIHGQVGTRYKTKWGIRKPIKHLSITCKYVKPMEWKGCIILQDIFLLSFPPNFSVRRCFNKVKHCWTR